MTGKQLCCDGNQDSVTDGASEVATRLHAARLEHCLRRGEHAMCGVSFVLGVFGFGQELRERSALHGDSRPIEEGAPLLIAGAGLIEIVLVSGCDDEHVAAVKRDERHAFAAEVGLEAAHVTHRHP